MILDHVYDSLNCSFVTNVFRCVYVAFDACEN